MDSLLDVVIRVYQNVPLETVIQALAAAGVLAVIVQKIKSWFEVQSSGVLNLLNFTFSAAVVMIQGLLSATAQNPALIPAEAASLFTLTIAAYHMPYVGIKALSNLLTEVKTRKEQKARIEEKHKEDEVPEVPIESVVPQFAPVTAEAVETPVSVTPVTPEEFAA